MYTITLFGVKTNGIKHRPTANITSILPLKMFPNKIVPRRNMQHPQTVTVLPTCSAHTTMFL